MFDFAQIDEIRLSAGNHDKPESGLCFMEMVAWFAGEKHSDKPQCACPVLGAYGIRLNDRMPDDLRDRLLKPLVPMIAGTFDKAGEIKRGEFLAMWATNKVLPIILRKRGFIKEAEACERAGNPSEAKNAAAAAAYAANAAAYAAYAAAYAAYAAYAANAADASANAANAANAAAYAANAAANAADASANAAYAANAAAYAANAANAANAADEIWTAAAEGLRQAILIGRHEGFADAVPVLVERRSKLRELVC